MVRNLVWHYKGRTPAEGVPEEGAEGHICTQEGRDDRRLEKTAYWGASWFISLAKLCSGDQIKEDEMGGACRMYGEEVKCIQNFGGETWRDKTTGKIRHRWEDNVKWISGYDTDTQQMFCLEVNGPTGARRECDFKSRRPLRGGRGQCGMLLCLVSCWWLNSHACHAPATPLTYN